MTHRYVRRLARFLDAAVLAYGVLVVITVFALSIGLVYLALFHEPPPD